MKIIYIYIYIYTYPLEIQIKPYKELKETLSHFYCDNRSKISMEKIRHDVEFKLVYMENIINKENKQCPLKKFFNTIKTTQ